MSDLNVKIGSDSALVIVNGTNVPLVNPGIRGFTGSRGADGTGLTIKGSLNDESELPVSGAAGDAYIINGDLYVWTGSVWDNVGQVQGPIGFTGSKGDIGFTGSQGTTGFVGSKGDVGFTGSQGPIGFTGSKGDIGFTGSHGIQGPIGFTGSQGIQGIQGFTGSKGDTGAGITIKGTLNDVSELPLTGSIGDAYIIGGDLYVWDGDSWNDVGPIQGPIGFTGSKGDIGFTGSAGTNGFTGSQGEVGFTGSQGIQGVQGFTGSQGEVGFTGSKGDLGFTGSQGIQGFTGSVGFTGSRGLDGQFGGATVKYFFENTAYPGTLPDGYLALDTTTFNTATFVALSDVDRNAVDITGFLSTIDSSTSDVKGYMKITLESDVNQYVIYEIIGSSSFHVDHYHLPVAYSSGVTATFADNAAISVSFTVHGDKGDTGFTGSQGIQGFTGSRGADGAIGFTGSAGSNGFTGSQGIQGDVGFTGSQGIQGPIGFTGSAGVNGFTGSAGENGATGFTGSAGVNGFAGSQGPIGFTGSAGANGEIGFTGSAGVNGFTGSQGLIGFTGSAGIEGSPGPTGFTGSAGTNGFTGSQGEIGFTGSRGDTGFTGSIGFTGSRGPTQAVTVSETTVTPTQNGEMWWDPSLGTLFINYNDGNSEQWVEATPAVPGPRGYTGSKGVNITTETEQTVTGLTFVDFTGIPSNVKKITIMFDRVSTDSSTNDFLVQIGTTSGIETTDYSSGSRSASGSGFTFRSDGFVIFNMGAAGIHSGLMVITNMSGNKWIESHALGETSNATGSPVGGGVKTLAGVLTRVRITTTGDTFDAGTVSIMYE